MDVNRLFGEVEIYHKWSLSVACVTHIVEPVLWGTVLPTTQHWHSPHIPTRHLYVLARFVHAVCEISWYGTVHRCDWVILAAWFRSCLVRIHEQTLMRVTCEVAVEVNEVALAGRTALEEVDRGLEVLIQGHDLTSATASTRWWPWNIALCRDPSTHHLEQKKSFKTIDIVSYALEVSVNGVTCVFVVHFRSSETS